MVVRGAGDKGVAVDANGDVYTGSEAFIRAFHSDGSEKWTFMQSEFAFILVGIAVGPDGNVYAAATEGMGVFSLTPEGGLRWQIPNPYDRIIIDYNEIVFGDNDGTGQLYFWANNRLQGITLSGNLVFSIGGGLPNCRSRTRRPLAPTAASTRRSAASRPTATCTGRSRRRIPTTSSRRARSAPTARTTTSRTFRSSSP